MSAVERVEHDPLPTEDRRRNEVSIVLQVIERIASDHTVDIDRLQKLLDMQERIMQRNAEAAFVSAYADMQPEIPIIDERGGIKDRAGNVQSTYAKWDDINEAVKPVLAAHGFALRFKVGQDGDRIMVTGILAHREGHTDETTFRLPADGSGSKNAVQALGSSISYGKRYCAMALLNITSRAKEDADDDGKAAGAGVVITEDQFAQLREMIDETGSNIEGFCRFFKVDGVAQLPAARFAEAIAKLKAKAARR